MLDRLEKKTDDDLEALDNPPAAKLCIHLLSCQTHGDDDGSLEILDEMMVMLVMAMMNGDDGAEEVLEKRKLNFVAVYFVSYWRLMMAFLSFFFCLMWYYTGTFVCVK